MQHETLDYRQPTTTVPGRSARSGALVIAATLLLAASVIWCAATWTNPGRFVFLPGGDVGLGFRSHAGRLQWIHFAPWQRHPDLVQWSLPWAAVFVVEASPAVMAILRRRRGRAASPADAARRRCH